MMMMMFTALPLHAKSAPLLLTATSSLHPLTIADVALITAPLTIADVALITAPLTIADVALITAPLTIANVALITAPLALYWKL